MKQDFVFHGVELLLNYYLSLFMTKRFFAGGMLALLACVSFASCTTGGGEEVQYVKIGQNRLLRSWRRAISRSKST